MSNRLKVCQVCQRSERQDLSGAAVHLTAPELGFVNHDVATYAGSLGRFQDTALIEKPIARLLFKS